MANLEVNAAGFTADELDAGKAFLQGIIDVHGEDYAGLVTRVTLIRVQVSAAHQDDQGLSESLIKEGIINELTLYSLEHPEVMDQDPAEFLNHLLGHSEEFVKIGSAASVAAAERERAGQDGEGFAASGAESEGSV